MLMVERVTVLFHYSGFMCNFSLFVVEDIYLTGLQFIQAHMVHKTLTPSPFFKYISATPSYLRSTLSTSLPPFSRLSPPSPLFLSLNLSPPVISLLIFRCDFLFIYQVDEWWSNMMTCIVAPVLLHRIMSRCFHGDWLFTSDSFSILFSQLFFYTIFFIITNKKRRDDANPYLYLYQFMMIERSCTTIWSLLAFFSIFIFFYLYIFFAIHDECMFYNKMS